MQSWHTPLETLFHQLNTRLSGLSGQEARQRLTEHGPNRLAEKAKRPAWKLFLDQFKSMLVIILLLASVMAGVVGDWKDTIVILLVVCFNGCLGFYQEFRAEKSLESLKKMLAAHARVRRNNQIEEIPAEELVPGDILLLEAGNRIAADARLLAAHQFQVNESSLTGESLPIEKQPQELAENTALAERRNMVFMNTTVTRGRAEAVVTATGMHTEMGKITQMLHEAEENPTPLQIQLDRLGHRLGLIALVVVTLIFILGLSRGEPLTSILLTSIALAVAAIPEGLPAVVTITLALGMRRMAKNRAILKRLAAVETLGAATAICSDKTGTLTLNQMTVRQAYVDGTPITISGEGYSSQGTIDKPAALDLSALARAASLVNDSRIDQGQLIGDPTEGALLAFAAKAGCDADELRRTCPRLAEIPFDSANKYMASFHALASGDIELLVKGAPDVLLAKSQVADSALWLAENSRMAREALRVLAVARRLIPAGEWDTAGDLSRYVAQLEILGLIGMIDPPRPEARQAIAVCQTAGITVRMITGDHKETAAAIASELGLKGAALTGNEIEGMSEELLREHVRTTAVFARVSPEHKVRIVRALNANGEVTAMTGDGVNDAPALKHAAIGVAMGITGTEVTKEAASMVLTDDNFATIVGAVREGRVIFENIIKFVRFQLSTNIGAILTVLGASLLGWHAPFTAIELLWINIIMDGPPAMTLALDPARRNIMQVPPRAVDGDILPLARLARLIGFGSVMAVGTLGIAAWSMASGFGDQVTATLVFTTFVLFQIFNAFNVRAEHGSAFGAHFFKNGRLWLALACVLGLQIAAVHAAPFQALFDTTDLTAGQWLMALAVASSLLWFDEGYKLWRQLRHRAHRH